VNDSIADNLPSCADCAELISENEVATEEENEDAAAAV